MKLPRIIVRRLPYKLKRLYWRRHQCPGIRPDGFRCVRYHHADAWHRDGRNVEWPA